jgi:hypothetical protein
MADVLFFESVQAKFDEQLDKFKKARDVGVVMNNADARVMSEWLERAENPTVPTPELKAEADKNGHVGLRYGPTDDYCAACDSMSRKAAMFGRDYSDWKDALADAATSAWKQSASASAFVLLMHQAFHNVIVKMLTDVPTTAACIWRGQKLYCQPWTPVSIARHYLQHDKTFASTFKAEMRDLLTYEMVGGLVKRAPDSITTADLNLLNILTGEPPQRAARRTASNQN